MNHEISRNLSGGKVPPAAVIQGVHVADQPETNRRAATFMSLSAYTLALRDPGLFAARYTVKPRLPS